MRQIDFNMLGNLQMLIQKLPKVTEPKEDGLVELMDDFLYWEKQTRFLLPWAIRYQLEKL